VFKGEIEGPCGNDGGNGHSRFSPSCMFTHMSLLREKIGAEGVTKRKELGGGKKSPGDRGT